MHGLCFTNGLGSTCKRYGHCFTNIGWVRHIYIYILIDCVIYIVFNIEVIAGDLFGRCSGIEVVSYSCVVHVLFERLSFSG